MRLPMIIALMIAGPAVAAPPTARGARISDAILNETIELGEEIESRGDGDLNGDGRIDTAYAVGSVDARAVHVLLSAHGGPTPYRPAGVLRLDTAALGAAKLSIAKGVLKVEDLSGGTTAIAATYRFRAEPGGAKMRLIGLDATLYSRTFAHDGFEMSWNLLTGDIVTRELRLSAGGGDPRYDRLFEQRFKRPSKPVHMEDTPDPEMVMVDIRKK